MSASAMSALLKDVKETGMPEAHGRKDIRASRTAAIQLASGPFGSLIQPVEVFDKKREANGAGHYLTTGLCHTCIWATWKLP